MFKIDENHGKYEIGQTVEVEQTMENEIETMEVLGLYLSNVDFEIVPTEPGRSSGAHQPCLPSLWGRQLEHRGLRWQSGNQQITSIDAFSFWESKKTKIMWFVWSEIEKGEIR